MYRERVCNVSNWWKFGVRPCSPGADEVMADRNTTSTFQLLLVVCPINNRVQTDNLKSNIAEGGFRKNLSGFVYTAPKRLHVQLLFQSQLICLHCSVSLACFPPLHNEVGTARKSEGASL
jgi:hypothetical protein